MLIPSIQGCMNKLAVLLKSEGQNATEYALTFAMVALVAVAGMQSLASGISHTFIVVSTTIGQHLQ